MSTCRNCQKEYYKKKDKYGCCSRNCITELKYNNFIKLWLAGKINGGGKEVSIYVRRYLFLKCKGKCIICGWDKINIFSKRTALIIDHISGNRKDHSEQNLRLICPNCHSLTATFGSLNKKIGFALREFLQDPFFNDHLYEEDIAAEEE